eukprot:TRINITY_DN5454_c0_g1_i1.p1 TRINITY_DN5454_c0_g1~~TRINITY_DN5454_c0_g1_i1.p1  ORF type:complete len:300 (-),score=61.97 TRINITY_DN5454_c0_g1_i1:76-975(-)
MNQQFEQVNNAQRHPIVERIMDLRDRHLANFCCLICLLSLVYYGGWVKPIPGPDLEQALQEKEKPGEFLGLTMEPLKSILVNTKIPPIVQISLEGIFDKNMEKVLEYERKKMENQDEEEGEEEDTAPIKWDGPEPDMIKYYRNRLTICKTQRVPCHESAMEVLEKELNHLLKYHPESPHNKKKLMVSEKTCIEKRDDLQKLHQDLFSLWPCGRNSEEKLRWDKFNKALMAAIERMDVIVSMVNKDEADIKLKYEEGLTFDKSLLKNLGSLSLRVDEEEKTAGLPQSTSASPEKKSITHP